MCASKLYITRNLKQNVKLISLLTCARVIVNVYGECVHDVLEPFDQDRVGQAFPQRQIEHLEVAVERVLVHGVDAGHFGQHEEKYGTEFGGWPVAVAQLVDVDGCFGAKLQLLCHLLLVIV